MDEGQLDFFDDKQLELPLYTHVDATRMATSVAGDISSVVCSGSNPS